ncbi:MAG: tetratricopeptide repeat protein [Vicinamibacterales bacterium]
MTRTTRRRGRPAQPATATVPTPAPGERTERRWRWLLAVFAVALTAGFVHLVELRAAPWSDWLMGDAAAYDAWARRIAGGDWIGQEVFYQAPLYPYFLGTLYALAGTSVWMVRVFQVLIGATSALLLADAGRRLFGLRTGLAAGCLFAIYPPVVFSTGLVQKSVLDLLFVCAAIWLLSGLLAASVPQAGAPPSRTRRRLVALGLVLGALMLTRENAAVMLAAVLVWVAVDRRFAGMRLVTAGLVLAGTAVVLAPVTVRNYAVGGEAYLTTSQFGPNFYIGNHRGADGTYQSLRPRRGNARYERQDAVEMAEAATGRPLSPAEVSAWFTGQSLAFIASEPGQWLQLLGRKTALLWNRVEIADTDDQYTAGEWSSIVGGLDSVLNMGLLAPLAAFGLVVTWSRRRDLWVLYLALAAYAASVVLFFVFARYRLPLVPLLVLFAAAGLAGAPHWLSTADPSRRAWAGALVAALLVFCNWPVVSADAMRATMHYNIGAVYLQDDQLEAAVGEFRTALTLKPGMPETLNNLGLAYGRLGRYADARDAFDHALAADPDFPEALVNSAEALLAMDEAAEARRRLERAVALTPESARAFHDLGRARAATGDGAGAERAYLRAADLEPGSERSLIALAELAGRQGRLDVARAYAERALAVDADSEEAHNNLGIIAAQSGRLEDAARHLERAAALAPALPQVHSNLAGVYAQLGRLEDARREFIRALELRPDHQGAQQGLREVERRLGLDEEDR